MRHFIAAYQIWPRSDAAGMDKGHPHPDPVDIFLDYGPTIGVVDGISQTSCGAVEERHLLRSPSQLPTEEMAGTVGRLDHVLPAPIAFAFHDILRLIAGRWISS